MRSRPNNPKMRLDKFISAQLNISRSEARTAIARGRAAVNGNVIRDAGFQIGEESDRITLDGNAIGFKRFVYIVMNKPAGVLSASTDKNRRTVIDLVPQEFCRRGLFPVGRLDKNTTGLLIITDDGDFAHGVLSPGREIYKTYRAELDGPVTPEMIEKFSAGVVLADGTRCKKAFLSSLGENKAEIRICEGKFHQIKRMFGTVGLGVNALERTAMGGFSLPPELPPGGCIEAEREALEAIFKG